MMYSFKNSKGMVWYLHTKVIELKGSKKMQTIYFFKKNIGQGLLQELPRGYRVVESIRSGLPVLKRLD